MQLNNRAKFAITRVVLGSVSSLAVLAQQSTRLPLIPDVGDSPRVAVEDSINKMSPSWCRRFLAW